MKTRLSWLLVSLVALLALPAAADAAPISANLSEGRMQLSGASGDYDLASSFGSLDFEAEETAGVFTVAQDDISFPQFELDPTTPIVLFPTSEFTGSYVEGSGALELKGTVDLVIYNDDLSASCDFNGLELDLTTSAAAPSGDFEGTQFGSGLESAPGSVVASWQELPNPVPGGTQDDCNALKAGIGGPGALQAGNDISLVPFEVEWDANRLQLDNGAYDTQFSPDPGSASSILSGVRELDDDSIRFDAEDVKLPRFALSSGEPVTVTPQSEGYTGTYDPVTGDLVFGGPSFVEIGVDGFGGTRSCRFIFNDDELNDGLMFSTESDAPSGDFRGAPFANGLDGSSGAAIAPFDLQLVPVLWVNNPPNCEAVRTQFQGPSAISIGNEIVAAPDPVLTVAASPTAAKVKQGRSKTFRVRVDSDGTRTRALDATVCARVPAGKRGLTLVGPRCKSAGDVSSETGAVAFKVKSTRRTAPKRYTLRFTATVEGSEPVSETSTLEVQKKRRRG